MHTPLPPDITGANPDRRGIADHYVPHPSLSDEMVQPDGCVRPCWRPFVSMLDELGPAELRGDGTTPAS